MPTTNFKLFGGVKSYGLGFDSTAYIAGNIFELYPGRQTVITQPGGGLSGVIPLAPGQIQNFYQPVSAQYLVPWRKEYRPTNVHHVGIKIKFQGEEYFANEEYFLINEPEAFTVEVTPVSKTKPVIAFKHSTERIEITPSKPKASLTLQRRVKIKKTDK